MALEASINKDFCMVIGTVGVVSLKEKSAPDQYDNTHNVSFTIQGLNKSGDPKKEKDSIWFVLGGQKVRDGKIQAKDSNGKWVDLVRGCEVKFPYTLNGDWWNVKKGQIVITNAVEAPASNTSGSGKPFDNTGIKVGHLQNCAENFIGSSAFMDANEYSRIVNEFDRITKEVAESVKAANPKFSTFDVDVNAGRAVLSASRNAQGDLEVVKQYALNGASNAVRDVVLAVVKGTSSDKPVEQKPVENTPKVNPQEPQIDFDDDIPF